jgi:signal transduction histidine kinase
MVFSGLWIGVEPPLSSVSLAQGITALVDNSLVLMALGLVIIFYHHSDVQSHLMLKRRQEELVVDTAKLRSLLVARERFLSAISDGISPPLSAIQQWSENAMVRYAKAPNALMVLEYNIRLALQSKLAIDELLEYSRLSAGGVSVHMQSLVLRDELHAFMKVLQTEPVVSGGDYALFLDKALPVIIYTDKDLLLQALAKLIQCTHTASGPRPLLIHVRTQSSAAIVISVEADSARGLATLSSSLGRLTLDDPDSPPGLAMPIAQSLAQLLGATAGVESAPERGPRFWIRLPIKQNTIPAG